MRAIKRKDNKENDNLHVAKTVSTVLGEGCQFELQINTNKKQSTTSAQRPLLPREFRGKHGKKLKLSYQSSSHCSNAQDEIFIALSPRSMMPTSHHKTI